jgi:hypothetical protein
MGNFLAGGGQDFRKALMLCLLTICFESLHGDMKSAQAQIHNRLQLIREWSVASRTPSVSDSELIRALIILDNKSIMMVDAEPVEITWQNETEHQLQLSDRPKHGTTRLNWPIRPYSTPKSAPFRQANFEQRLSHLQSFKQRHSDFLPLWFHSWTPTGHKDFLPATALEMGFKTIYTDHFKGKTCYDAHLADCQEIFILAETLIRHEETDNDTRMATFTFDDPIVSCLYSVTLRCGTLSFGGEQ